ncbi:MAG: GerMN domain-containing protein [Chitinophagales bacterium]
MKKYYILGFLIILSVIASGCDRIGINNQIKSWKEAVKEPVERDPMTPEDLIQETKTPVKQITVQLYFARKDGDGLAIENRRINMVDGIARATIQELIQGPKKSDLIATLPVGTRLKDINIRPDGTCQIDFNKALENLTDEKAGNLAIYSVVNTLSQFATVDNVIFMVEGKEVESLGGVVNTSAPVEADYELVNE